MTVQYQEDMEHQNDSGREKLDADSNGEKNSTKEDNKEKSSHSVSFRSEDCADILMRKLDDCSKNTSRQGSISSTISGTTRPDQGRAEDFFSVSTKFLRQNFLTMVVS